MHGMSTPQPVALPHPHACPYPYPSLCWCSQDERMLDLMGFMAAPCLGRLACVSRALYVFAHVDELWKGLVVQVCCVRGTVL